MLPIGNFIKGLASSGGRLPMYNVFVAEPLSAADEQAKLAKAKITAPHIGRPKSAPSTRSEIRILGRDLFMSSKTGPGLAHAI